MSPAAAAASRLRRQKVAGESSHWPGRQREQQEQQSWPAASSNAMSPVTASFPCPFLPTPLAEQGWGVCMCVCVCWGGLFALLSCAFLCVDPPAPVCLLLS